MTFSASISGLNAAATRIDVSANNIANIGSTQKVENGTVKQQKFIPSDVIDISGQNGVQSVVRQSSNADQNINPDVSPEAQSNVDLSTEVVNHLQAKNAYEANLKALEVQNKVEKDTLNIIS